MREEIYTVFLLAAAWQDGRRMKIRTRLLEVFGAVGAVLWVQEAEMRGELLLPGTWMRAGVSFLPGLMLLAASFYTDEIGAGDGLFFLVSGFYLSCGTVFLLFAGALAGCAAVGIFFLFRCGKKGRKLRIPFLPFLIPPWIFYLAGGFG